MNNSQNLYSNSNVDSNDKASLPKLWLFSRIICFLVALGIWIYVVNVTTQEYEKTFSLIDITFTLCFFSIFLYFKAAETLEYSVLQITCVVAVA